MIWTILDHPLVSNSSERGQKKKKKTKLIEPINKVGKYFLCECENYWTCNVIFISLS